jgi:hypothetical protein
MLKFVLFPKLDLKCVVTWFYGINISKINGYVSFGVDFRGPSHLFRLWCFLGFINILYVTPRYPCASVASILASSSGFTL